MKEFYKYDCWRFEDIRPPFLASLLNLTYWNHFFTDSGLSLHMCIYMHFFTINNWLGAPKCWGIPAKPYNVSRSIVFLPPLRFQFTGCFFFTAVTVTPERFTYQTCSFIYCICPAIWRFEKWKKTTLTPSCLCINALCVHIDSQTASTQSLVLHYGPLPLLYQAIRTIMPDLKGPPSPKWPSIRGKVSENVTQK